MPARSRQVPASEILPAMHEAGRLALQAAIGDAPVPGALAEYLDGTLGLAPPVVAPEPPQPDPGYWVGGGVRAVLAARGWTALSPELYPSAGRSETLASTPGGPRVLSYWSATDRVYVGPVLEDVTE